MGNGKRETGQAGNGPAFPPLGSNFGDEGFPMRHDSEGVLTMASSGKPEESAQPSLSRTALVEINARHFHYNRYADDRSGRALITANLGDCRVGKGLPVLHLHGESSAGTAPPKPLVAHAPLRDTMYSAGCHGNVGGKRRRRSLASGSPCCCDSLRRV